MYVDTPNDRVIRDFLTLRLHTYENRMLSTLRQLGQRTTAGPLRAQLRSELTEARVVYALWSEVGGWDVLPETDANYHAVTSKAVTYLAGTHNR